MAKNIQEEPGEHDAMQVKDAFGKAETRVVSNAAERSSGIILSDQTIF